MRDQYSGDVTDFIKFAFLRVLACNHGPLGVAWYYAPSDDGRRDGRHLEWRDELTWRRLDPDLFDALSKLPNRSIAALEKLPIWPPGTVFHREAMPRQSLRNAWGIRMREALAPANLIFLDPDNGLGSHTEKHATFDEVRAFRGSERILVFISFPGRVSHDFQVQELHGRLKLETGTGVVHTLQTSVAVSVLNKHGDYQFVPRTRWFTVIDSSPSTVARSRRFAEALSTIPRVKAQLVNSENNGQ